MMWLAVYTVDDPGPGFMGMLMGMIVGFICMLTFFWIHDKVHDWKRDKWWREKRQERWDN